MIIVIFLQKKIENKYKESNSNTLPKINEKFYPKSTNFTDRKNFAHFYLSDQTQAKPSALKKNIPYNIPNQNNIIYNQNNLHNSWSPHELYFKESFLSYSKDNERALDRIKSLEEKVVPKKLEFYEYNKRNDFAVFKEKPPKRTLLYYLHDTDDCMYNKSVQIQPMQPLYK